MLTCTVKGLKLGAQRGEKRKQTVCGAVGRRELIPGELFMKFQVS
jgi:hypothetical protein